jgi:very-short-patch-repair endonuclease
MVRLYQGRKQVAFPEDVKRIAERARLTQESAADLEKKLWALIRPALAQGTAFRP